MAKIKNTTGEDRLLPWLGERLVLAGQVVDVPDDTVYAYTQQDGWEPADEEAKALHDQAATLDEAVAEVEAGGSLTSPARSASRADWVAYVAGANLAPLDALDGLTRDEIRDTYTVQED